MRRTRRTRVALLLAVLSGWVSAAGQTVRHHKIAEEDPSFPPELIQAETAIEKKDFAAAEPLLKKVVSGDPKNYQAWFDLGFVYNGLGNMAESIAAYRQAVAAKPDVFESNLNLGLSLAKAGQADAAQYLQAATLLKPTAKGKVDEGHARAWLSLAGVLAASKPDEAIAAYQQAAALTPKDPEPHLAAGSLLEKASRFADAEQEYKLALALDPASDEALTGLANIYARGNRFADAQQMLDKIVALHPDDVQARLELTRVLVLMGKTDDALASAQALSKLEPGNPKVQRDLADLYMDAKKYEQAEAAYRSLLTPKSDADLHHALGVALLKQRKFTEAEQEFLAAIKLKPDFGEAYGDLAVAAVENKDYPLAIKAADARARFLPEIPISYFLRASAYDHLRQFKPAAENYHKFLETADGKYPDQEWQARHRLITIEPKR